MKGKIISLLEHALLIFLGGYYAILAVLDVIVVFLYLTLDPGTTNYYTVENLIHSTEFLVGVISIIFYTAVLFAYINTKDKDIDKLEERDEDETND